jgi:hypothetical protein
MNAAPLKPRLRGVPDSSRVDFPRSQERGPVEALLHTMPVLLGGFLAFRVRKSAAPLKLRDLDGRHDRYGAFRVRRNAAPLKRRHREVEPDQAAAPSAFIKNAAPLKRGVIGYKMRWDVLLPRS